MIGTAQHRRMLQDSRLVRDGSQWLPARADYFDGSGSDEDRVRNRSGSNEVLESKIKANDKNPWGMTRKSPSCEGL